MSSVVGTSEAGSGPSDGDGPGVPAPTTDLAVAAAAGADGGVASAGVLAGLPPPVGPPPDPRLVRVIPWSGRRALVATVAVLAVDYLAGWGLFSLSEPAGDVYLAVGSLLVTCVGVWLAVRRWGRPGILAVLGWRPRPVDVTVGVGVGLLILGVDTMITAVASLVLPLDDSANPQAWIDAAMLAAPVTTLIAVVVTGPVAEEVLFRGLLFRGLGRRLGTIGAAVVSAALFAAVHPTDLSPGSILLLASVFVSGLLFAAVTALRRSLVPAIVAHVVVNATVSLLAGVPGTLPWVVEAGPESMVVAFDLETGECGTGFPDQAPHGVGTAWQPTAAVDCQAPHDFEVYDVHPLGGPDDVFPGRGALATTSDAHCYEAFEHYVGLAYPDSALDYLAVVPDEPAWTTGRREVRCLLIDLHRNVLDQPMAGSRR